MKSNNSKPTCVLDRIFSEGNGIQNTSSVRELSEECNQTSIHQQLQICQDHSKGSRYSPQLNRQQSTIMQEKHYGVATVQNRSARGSAMMTQGHKRQCPLAIPGFTPPVCDSRWQFNTSSKSETLKVRRHQTGVMVTRCWILSRHHHSTCLCYRGGCKAQRGGGTERPPTAVHRNQRIYPPPATNTEIIEASPSS